MPVQRKRSTTSANVQAFDQRDFAVPEALKYFDDLPDSAFVRQPVVEGLFSCSSATVWRYVKLGHIPAPTRSAGRITAWNVGALRRALANA